MRVAIGGGETENREDLLSTIRQVLAKRSAVYGVWEFGSAEELLCEIEEGALFDLIFLEADETALQAAQRLRRLPYDGDLVFVGDTSHWAVAGYDVDAAGYLLRPYSGERMEQLLMRLGCRVHTACLTVRRHQSFVRIPYHEILYAESRNTKCFIHRVDGSSYAVYRHLDEIERELDDARFLRCHQSFLVNMDHVRRMDREFELVGGAIVCIRQRELRHIRDRYLSYLETVKFENLE